MMDSFVFLRFCIVEFKLLLRGKWLWTLLVVMGVLSWLLALNPYRKNDWGYLVTNPLIAYYLPLFLLAVLVAGALARRDSVERTNLVTDSLPYPVWQMHLSRLLVLALPFTLLSWGPLAVYAIGLPGFGLHYSHNAWIGMLILFSYCVPVWFCLIGSYALVTWLRKRWSYLLGVAWVLFLTLAGQLLAGMMTAAHFQWLNYSKADIGVNGIYHMVWGFTVTSEFWLHRLFYIFMTLLICTCLCAVLAWRRREKQRILLVSAWVLLLAVGMVYAFSGYEKEWGAREQYLSGEHHFYQQRLIQENPPMLNLGVVDAFMKGNPTPQRVNALTEDHQQELLNKQTYEGMVATDYQMRLTLEDDHGMSAEVKLLIVNGSAQALDTLPLMLKHHFVIDEVKVGGQSVSAEWEEERDILLIPLQQQLGIGGMAEVDVKYHGKVNDWRFLYQNSPVNDRWTRMAFVDHDRLFLPSYYGWYPQPGYDRLVEYRKFYQNSRLVESLEQTHPILSPANFDVTVTWRGPMRIVNGADTVSVSVSSDQGNMSKESHTVHFMADASPGFSLIGGWLYKETASWAHGDISLIIPGHTKPGAATRAAEAFAELTENTYRILGELFGEVRFPGELTLMANDYPSYYHQSGYLNEAVHHTLGDTDIEWLSGDQIAFGEYEKDRIRFNYTQYLTRYTLKAEINRLDSSATASIFYDAISGVAAHREGASSLFVYTYHSEPHRLLDLLFRQHPEQFTSVLQRWLHEMKVQKDWRMSDLVQFLKAEAGEAG